MQRLSTRQARQLTNGSYTDEQLETLIEDAERIASYLLDSFVANGRPRNTRTDIHKGMDTDDDVELNAEALVEGGMDWATARRLARANKDEQRKCQTH